MLCLFRSDTVCFVYVPDTALSYIYIYYIVTAAAPFSNLHHHRDPRPLYYKLLTKQRTINSVASILFLLISFLKPRGGSVREVAGSFTYYFSLARRLEFMSYVGRLGQVLLVSPILCLSPSIERERERLSQSASVVIWNSPIGCALNISLLNSNNKLLQ